MNDKPNLPNYLVHKLVALALEEDINNTPDWTANLIAKDKKTTAYIVTNEDMVLCGMEFANAAFMQIDPGIETTWHVAEGNHINSGTKLCTVSGRSASILTSERIALNFLQTLSATATITNKFIAAVQPQPVQIMDTRKTIPGLRLAQKYAVLVGGGTNQRIGLFDGVLIKENHIIAHGGIGKVLAHAFSVTPQHIPIQIEVETFNELVEAVAAKAKLILLDNMSVEETAKCAAFCKDKDIVLEASGNINLQNIKQYAMTGVKRISIGSLTKNINAIDLSMRLTHCL